MKVIVNVPIFDGESEITCVARTVEMQCLPPINCELRFDLTTKRDPGTSYDNLWLYVAGFQWNPEGWFIVITSPVNFRERWLEGGERVYANEDEFLSELERLGWNLDQFFWGSESTT